jgi:hypothetical protein
VDAAQADTASARNDDFMLVFEASDRPSPNQSPLRLTASELCDSDETGEFFYDPERPSS